MTSKRKNIYTEIYSYWRYPLLDEHCIEKNHDEKKTTQTKCGAWISLKTRRGVVSNAIVLKHHACM